MKFWRFFSLGRCSIDSKLFRSSQSHTGWNYLHQHVLTLPHFTASRPPGEDESTSSSDEASIQDAPGALPAGQSADHDVADREYGNYVAALFREMTENPPTMDEAIGLYSNMGANAPELHAVPNCSSHCGELPQPRQPHVPDRSRVLPGAIDTLRFLIGKPPPDASRYEEDQRPLREAFSEWLEIAAMQHITNKIEFYVPPSSMALDSHRQGISWACQTPPMVLKTLFLTLDGARTTSYKDGQFNREKFAAAVRRAVEVARYYMYHRPEFVANQLAKEIAEKARKREGPPGPQR